MTAPEDIATEHWTVEPYSRDEIATYILTGDIRILCNVNLEIDEMHAITALPELFALAFAVLSGDDRVREMATAAIAKATKGLSDGTSI